jgi:hypothetical protein
MPRLLTVIAVLCVAAVALLPSSAVAKPPHKCKSADLRYPFRPGEPKLFGVFKLRITNGKCRTAHRVAERWMTRFEANLRAGRVKLPRSVDGFAFETLPAHAAQTYSERGHKRHTTIRFDYRVPNG